MTTVFLSAASDDLEALRNVLHGAFSRAQFRVFTQKRSLGSPDGDLHEYLVDHIKQSDFVIHLAGSAYGSDATAPFPEAPGFQCSWTQFEYYYAHSIGKRVIAFVCAPDLSTPGFVNADGTTKESEHLRLLQKAHRDRVASGEFDGTPLQGKVKRTLNEKVNSQDDLIQAIAAAVATMQSRGGKPVHLEALPRLHQLPTDPRQLGFVGRVTDLQELLRQAATGTAAITGLRGMGGIGKTALSMVLAHELAPRFPDAQIVVDGLGTSPQPPSARQLQTKVLTAFNPDYERALPDSDAEVTAVYRQILEGKRILVVVDNAADTKQVLPLLPPAGCGLIVSSRQPVQFGPGKIAHLLGRLPEADAIALLREYHPGLSDADAQELASLCYGLPLALKLAGSHVMLDGPQPNVQGYLRQLKAGPLGALDPEAADAGEQTISETLRLSEAMLTPEQRDAWRALGVFAHEFDERAAAAIMGSAGVAGASQAASVLTVLVRRSLLEKPGSDRYQMHDLAAEYARTQLGEQAVATLRLAHARYYLSVAQHAEYELYLKGKALEGLALFDAERAGIEAAFAWLSSICLPAGDERPTKMPGEPSRSHEQESQGNRLLIDLVHAVVYTGDLRFHMRRQRIPWLEAQRTAAQRLGDRGAEGNALGNLGNAHAALGDVRRAVEFHELALVAMREIGNRRGEGNALGNLGNAHAALDDARQAIEFHEQHRDIAREIGDRRGEGAALGNLGNAHAALGDARQAIEFYEQRLVIAREIGDRSGEGTALYNLADEQWKQGDRAAAIANMQASLVIHEANEDPWAPKVRAALTQWTT